MFNYLYQGIYRTCFNMIGWRLSTIQGVSDVYAKINFELDWHPGLSDIDLTVVLDSALSASEQSAVRELAQQKLKFWKLWVPMLGETILPDQTDHQRIIRFGPSPANTFRYVIRPFSRGKQSLKDDVPNAEKQLFFTIKRFIDLVLPRFINAGSSDNFLDVEVSKRVMLQARTRLKNFTMTESSVHTGDSLLKDLFALLREMNEVCGLALANRGISQKSLTEITQLETERVPGTNHITVYDWVNPFKTSGPKITMLILHDEFRYPELVAALGFMEGRAGSMMLPQNVWQLWTKYHPWMVGEDNLSDFYVRVFYGFALSGLQLYSVANIAGDDSKKADSVSEAHFVAKKLNENVPANLDFVALIKNIGNDID